MPRKQKTDAEVAMMALQELKKLFNNLIVKNKNDRIGDHPYGENGHGENVRILGVGAMLAYRKLIDERAEFINERFDQWIEVFKDFKVEDDQPM